MSGHCCTSHRTMSLDRNGGVVFLFRGENKLKYVTFWELLEGTYMAVLLCVF